MDSNLQELECDAKNNLKILLEVYKQLTTGNSTSATLLSDYKFWMNGVAAVINATTNEELHRLCVTYICSVTPQRYPVTVEAMKMFMSSLQGRIYYVQTNRMVTKSSEAIALALFQNLIQKIAHSRALDMDKMITNLANESRKCFPPE